MRGRGKDAFLAELHVRATASRTAPSAPAALGVDAAEAWATGDILPPLSRLPGIPQTPSTPPSLTSGTASAPGIDPVALEHLAGRTAVQAYRLLTEILRSDMEQFDSDTERFDSDAEGLGTAAVPPQRQPVDRARRRDPAAPRPGRPLDPRGRTRG
ncbi:hypothetical protein GCM10010339_27700 [Streptomyces alanosinicus]|uniref:Uncharacterized protein n=1 Tax=Streptomyces alanosinicus TaxID=68171 RepID=A0A918YI12_9ACTN|nr:hypothetical protein GCM10010339_27700 [Streptomyces alanosinicus]